MFSPKTFTLPTVIGISEKTLSEHLKLYAGYVKNTNHILERIEELSGDSLKYAYELGELQRRFSFEWNGMKNHEVYFDALVDGPVPLASENTLASALTKTWGSIDAFLARFRAIGLTRGIGWALLAHNKETNTLHTFWVDEQHLGIPANVTVLLALDMWEHSYLMDYTPGEKGKYIDAYLDAINWDTVYKHYEQAQKHAVQ